ncbi:hypothetical protein BN2537_13 [Streptomyces venezuelae]|nr:hypothetical protein BN2537_13 [Streptomyces venezuelae]
MGPPRSGGGFVAHSLVGVDGAVLVEAWVERCGSVRADVRRARALRSVGAHRSRRRERAIR